MSSTSSIALRWVLGGICLAVVGYLLVSGGHLVKLVIISALLAYIIDPLASALESRGLSRAAATTIIFIVIVGVMSVAFLVIAPVLVKQLMAIQSSFKAGSADAMLQRLERALQAYFTAFDFRDLNLSERLQALTGSAAQWIFAHIMDFVSLLTNIILIPFMVFFFLKDGRQFKKHLVGLVPNRYFELTLNLIYKMDLQLGNYLRGQFLDALIIGVLSTGALWLLNVKYFFLSAPLPALPIDSVPGAGCGRCARHDRLGDRHR
jgi:predicted PurR-regulated permease PerM